MFVWSCALYVTKSEHYTTNIYIFFLWQGDGAIQKGMPHKTYHGKTGRVFNVTKRGLGVIVNKQVK